MRWAQSELEAAGTHCWNMYHVLLHMYCKVPFMMHLLTVYDIQRQAQAYLRRPLAILHVEGAEGASSAANGLRLESGTWNVDVPANGRLFPRVL